MTWRTVRVRTCDCKVADGTHWFQQGKRQLCGIRSTIAFPNVFSVINLYNYDDVIKWKHFPRYWPSLCEEKSSVSGEFPSQKPVWRRFDVFIDLRLSKQLANHRKADDSECHSVHFDVTLMTMVSLHVIYNSLKSPATACESQPTALKEWLHALEL